MQPAVMGIIGCVMVVGGVLAIIFSRRTAERRGRPETVFRYAWSSVAVWFGALPVIGAIVDVAHLPAKSLDGAYALVLGAGLSVTLWFVVAGMRARRAEFDDLQREFIAEDRTPPRYFWTPWAIFGWTLGFGTALVFGGGLAIGSGIGAFLGDLTAEDVDRIAQGLANVLTVVRSHCCRSRPRQVCGDGGGCAPNRATNCWRMLICPPSGFIPYLDRPGLPGLQTGIRIS